MGKLTTLHINIIGLVAALIVAGGLYYTMITGAQDERQKAEASEKAVSDRAAKLKTALGNLKSAEKARDLAIASYTVYEKQYMPVVNYNQDRVVNMMRDFWPNNGKSWPERFRRTVNAHMSRESKRNGVVWLNPGDLVLGPYGPNPNTIDAGKPGEELGPVLHFDMTVQIRASSIRAIEQHVKNWPSIRGAGVPVVTNLRITGNSPDLEAVYNLTLTIILRDTDKIPAKNPRISGSSGSGGGGGRGGFGGGAPTGMMPGMMGGPGGGGGSGGMMGGGGGSGGGSTRSGKMND